MSGSEKTFIVKLSLPVASSSPKNLFKLNWNARPAYFKKIFYSEKMDIIREIAILPFPKPDNYHGTLSKWVKDGNYRLFTWLFSHVTNGYGIKMQKLQIFWVKMHKIVSLDLFKWI